MVGVAGFPIRKNDGFGPELSNDGGQTELVLAAGLNIRVGNAKRAAPAYAKYLGGFGGLFGAGFGSAAGTHFARGEVEDAGLVAGVRHFQERAAAGEFHVVGVGGNGEQIKFHARSPIALILLSFAKYRIVGAAGKSGSRAAALQSTTLQGSVGLMIAPRVVIHAGTVISACGNVSSGGNLMTENTAEQRVSLTGKVALVTGSAKRLGRAVALRLAEEGADLVIHHGASHAEAQETVGEIEKLGRRAVALSADLQKVDEIRKLFVQVAKEFGRLDILVNSAANFLPASIVSTTEEIWDASLNTNLKAGFFCAQAAAPLLRRTKGAIVNFADAGGLMGWPGYIPHSISKAGVVMLTKVLAKALAPEVRVNAIAPGTITMPGDPPEWEADFDKLAPLQRTGTPRDIADAVSYLVHAEFMTGHTLVLDGGRILGPAKEEFR